MNPDNTGNHPVSEVEIATSGTVVHLKGYGFIKVFKIVAKDLTIEYWATNDLGMSELKRLKLAFAWTIEEYHRVPAVLRSRALPTPFLSGTAQPYRFSNPSLFAAGSSLADNRHKFWLEAKVDIVRAAVRAYLAYPRYCLTPSA